MMTRQPLRRGARSDTGGPGAATPTPRPRCLRRLGAAAAAVALLAGLGRAVAAAPGQELVAEATVEANAPVDEAALLEVLGLEAGSAIDRRKIREAILALYAGGEVEWIVVEASPVDGGQAVVVRASFRSKISKVDVATANPLLKNQVKRWMALAPGEPVSSAKVEAGRRRALRRLRDRGHVDPRVNVFLDFRRETNTVAVSVEVEPGPVEVLQSVQVEGLADPELARDVTPNVGLGKRLTARLEERIRSDVENELRRRGFWEARVVGVERQHDGASTVLVVRADPGPRYELVLDAPAAAEDVVRKAFPDPVDEDVHPAQTDALADRIRENLQLEGYLLASVTVTLDADRSPHVLTVRADPGRTRRIAAVELPGALSLDRDALRNAIQVDPGRTGGLLGHPVSDATLEADRRAIEARYRAAGYVDVQVAPPVLEPVGENEVRVLFPVEEGRQWLLEDLRVEGLPVEAAARIEDTALDLQEAAPWDPQAVRATERQLAAALANSGYPEAVVTTHVDTSEPGRAQVLFMVEPGDYVEIGEIVVAGLRKTRRSVVDRMLRAAGVVPGAPFARDRLLEAQRRLYELGLFRTVELFPMPGQERRRSRGLVVHLEEGAQRSYLVGFGWNETDRWRATLGWSHLNLFGGAHALSIEGRLSSNEQRFQIGLREPRIPYLDLPGYLVFYRTFEQFENRGYEQRRRGLWFDVGDRRRVPFRTWLRYEYQIVEPTPIGEGAGDPDLPREDQEARIASLTPTLEWDFRDDPLVPTRGTFSQISLEWAFPVFDADAEFLKLWARSTVYGSFNRGTWAAGARVGLIEPLGSGDGSPANLQIPLAARYFAGGASTHRGFERDLLGIAGQTLTSEGDPVGGNALLLLNVEVERPVARLLSGVVFLDVGNVWAEPDLVRLAELRWAAGLGLRVLTPAGPLRAEYGWKLDREEGESSGEFFLSFGIPF